MKFFDTNIFLRHLDVVDKESFFLISSVTLQELENIKTSKNKTEEIRYAARKATRYLDENPGKYRVVTYKTGFDNILEKMSLEPTNDYKILASATTCDIMDDDLIFVTNDILAKIAARDLFNLKVESVAENTMDEYKGFIEKSLSDEEMAYFYEHMDENIFNLLINQYVLINNEAGITVDIYKWNGLCNEHVNYTTFTSKYLDPLKPLDNVQKCAMDSISKNDITVLYGKAGSGKTTLPLSYIMQEIEKGTYTKCYLIYSYEPLKGAKTLGYEKGDHQTKLLYSSSIGNLLSSKFGDIHQVEYMMDKGILDIIPTANIRGVEFEKDSICFSTECQNLDVYTLKNIIHRCKYGFKKIYEGDIN